jgi:hypothetical protein
MACLLKIKEMLEFSAKPTSWKIILEPMAGNFVISEAHALVNAVLSKAEKTFALWGISWSHRMYAILAEVWH